MAQTPSGDPEMLVDLKSLSTIQPLHFRKLSPNYHRVWHHQSAELLFVETLMLMSSKSDNFVDFAVARGIFKGMTRFLIKMCNFIKIITGNLSGKGTKNRNF